MPIEKQHYWKVFKAVRGSLLSVLRLATGRWRALPDFIIVGAQKAGTTAMFNCLGEHPDVEVSTKQVHYFDNNYQKGERWYRSHFPLARKLRKYGRLTGEATPYYVFHPLAMRRLVESLPEAKLIVMLRDPVERALSHYFHEVRYGNECKPIEQAFGDEEARLKGEREKLVRNPGGHSFAYQHYSYVARGMYFEQLVQYSDLIESGRILVLRSEDFFNDPAGTYAEVLSYLGLRPYPVSSEPVANVGVRGAVPERLRSRLEEAFKPDQARLDDLLNRRAIEPQAVACKESVERVVSHH